MKLKQEDLEFITTSKMAEEAGYLASYLSPNTVGVIALPRSGLIPATILSTTNHLALMELQPDGLVRQMGLSGRASINIPKRRFPHYLVVDDSCYGGGRIKAARELLRNYNVTFAVVYARSEMMGVVDCCVKVTDKTHLFQWNFVNSGMACGRSLDKRILGGFGFDMDGVLCEDSTFNHSSSNIDEVIRWIHTARPRNLPRYSSVKLICSYRLESMRRDTEEWLEKWDCKYDKLVLCHTKTFEQRDISGRFNPCVQKGFAMANSTCKIFFESDERQGEEIARISGKPCIIPSTGRIFWPSGVEEV